MLAVPGGWLKLAATLIAVAATAAVALDAGVLMSVNPLGASPGVAIQITGTGFNAAPAANLVTISPSAGGPPRTAFASSVATLNAAQGIRRLNVVVPVDLPAGPATLRVTNTASGEISEGLAFDVLHLALPGVSSGEPGATGLSVVITGSPRAQFVAGTATRVLFGAGVTVRSTTVETPQRLVAVIDIAPSAAPGARPVAVRPPNQSLLLDGGFTVGAAPPVNRPPRITSTAPLTAAVGQTYTYSAVAEDDDGDAVTWSLQQAPAGMAVGAATGVITWTPLVSQAGPHAVVVHAADGRGGGGSQSFEVQVAAPAVIGISLQPTMARFSAAGQTRALQVIGLRSDGGTADLTGASTGTTYESSHAFVASVSADGVITALASGETAITVRHQALSAAASAIVEIGVTLDALELTPAASTLRAVGAAAALTLRGQFSDGTVRDLTTAGGSSYTSSSDAVATVAANGVVTAAGPGATTITASHGDRTASAEVSVVIAEGEGFVRGQVFDDRRGLPLPGAVVSLVADGSGAYDNPPATVSDDRGRYVIPARSGDVVVRAVKDGFTSVERRALLPSAGIVRLLDARLTPLDGSATAISSAFGGQALDTARTMTVDVPPGSVPADTMLRVTPAGAQGLAGRLPLGWSAMGAAEVTPAGLTLFNPATLTLPNADTLAAGTPVTVVGYDTAAHSWQVMGTAQVSADGRTVAFPVTSTGQFALVLADTAPFEPPVPVVGHALAGVDAVAVPADVDAAGSVVPRSAPPGDNVRALGRIGLTAPTPLPSGTGVQVHVSEAFELVDTSRTVPLPFTQDILVHARPRPPSGSPLGAAFPITPSRSYSIQELLHGVVTLDVAVASDAAAGSVAGPDGAVVVNDTGDMLIVPAASLGAETVVRLERRVNAALPPGLSGAYQLIAGLDVDIVGVTFSVPARLSIARPAALLETDQVLLAQAFVDALGVQRLRIAGTGAIEGDRLVSQHAGGAVPFDGVTRGGQYLLIKVDEPVGFVTGIVTGPDGSTPASPALVTADTAPFADVTSAAGRYLVAARAAAATQVVATHLVSRDQTRGTALVSERGAVVTLPLTLAIVPPAVTATSPAAGAVDVPLDSPILIDFSEAIDPASVTGASVDLQAGGASIAATRELSQDRRRLTIRPGAPLAPRTTFSLTLTSSLRDLSGSPLLSFAPLTFSTLDPSRPPQPPPGQVTATLPDTDGLVLVFGTIGAAEAGSGVTATNLRTQETTSVMALEDGSFRLRIGALVGDEITLTFRDGSGRETTVVISQLIGEDGSTTVGRQGGVIDAGGRVGTILPRALTAPGVFRIADAVGATGPTLDAPFSYTDRFALSVEGATFNRLSSLTLTESQRRFEPATDVSAPFAASGALTVPSDFLVNVALRYAAVVQDTAGTRRTASISTVVVAASPDAAPAHASHLADFPTVFVTAPRESAPGLVTGARAEAPAARIDLRVPAPPAQPGADLFLLARVMEVEGQPRLSVVDRLDREGEAGGELRTSGRELPGMQAAGDYVIVRSAEPLVFVTGRLTGAEGVVIVDGLPFVFQTDGPNASFAVPVPADRPFTLRFVGADGLLRGTASGQAPASGTLDLGDPLQPTAGQLAVTAEPGAGSIVDIGAPIVFRFSAPIDVRTLAAGIVVTDAAGARVFGTFADSDGASTVAFRPFRRWRFATLYRYGVSTSVVALSGARLPQPFNGTFTTFAPERLGSARIGTVSAVDGAGTIALAGSASGSHVLDVSSPRLPRQLAARTDAGGAAVTAFSPSLLLTDRNGQGVTGAFGIVLHGDVNSGIGLRLFGLGSPAAPTAFGTVQLTPPGMPGAAMDVAVDAGRAYAALDSAGLVSVRLGQLIPENPADPAAAIEARYPSSGSERVSGVAVLGGRLVLAGPGGLTLLDRATLQRIGGTASGPLRDVATLSSFAMDLNGDGTVSGPEVFDLAVATGGVDGTLQFFRLPPSGDPVMIAVVRVSGDATSVVLDRDERLALVGLGSRGVAIVDLDGPGSVQPLDIDRNSLDDRVLATVDTLGTAQRLAPTLDRGTLLVANGEAGVATVQVLPARTAFVSLRRDPARAVAGDEEEILLSREALTTDEAITARIEALAPGGSELRLVLNGSTGSGLPVFSFADGTSSAALVDGTNDVSVAIDPAAARAADTGTLTVRTSSGADVASLTFRLRAGGAGEEGAVSLRLAPSTVVLSAAAREQQVAVLATGGDGRTVNVSAPVHGTTYRTLQPGVASVDASGLVSAVAGGATIIEARLGTLVARGLVRVDAPVQVASLESDRPHLTLTALGQVAPLPLTVRRTDGSVHAGALSAAGITFATLSPLVVSVDADGRVTALSEGVASVTASRGGMTVSFQVAVALRTPPTVTAIAFEAFSGPIGTDEGMAEARAQLTGTGSLEGLTVTFVANGRTLQTETDYTGMAAIRLRGFTVAGSFPVTARVVDPSSSATRSAGTTLEVVAGGEDAEPNDSVAAAVPLRLGRAVDGALSSADLADFYRVESSEGGTLIVSARVSGTASVSIRVRILDVSGTLLTQATAGLGVTRLSQPVGAGATIVAVDHLAGTPSYSLQVRLDQAPVLITGVSPGSGGPGTPVTIAGSGFSLDPRRNAVYFGRIAARVVASSATELQTVVPAAAFDGPLEVVASDRRATGPVFIAGRQGRPQITLEPHAPGAVRLDPVSGSPLVVNRLSVFFDPSATRASVDAFAAAAGGRVVGVNEVLSRYVLEFAAIGTIPALHALKGQIASDPAVSLVTLESFVTMAQQPRHLSDLETYTQTMNVGGIAVGVNASSPMLSIGFGQAYDAVRRSPQFRAGLRPVTVGLVDSGFDPGPHRDEFRRADGVPIWSLFTRNATNGFELTPPHDPVRHGTAVTGVIAALDNGIGLSGILGSFYTPASVNFDVVIYGLRSPLDTTPISDTFSTSGVIDAVTDITITGTLDVLNLSLGEHSGGTQFDETKEAYRRALQGLGGRTVVVAAAGNDGAYADHFLPSALEDELPYLLSVGGTAVMSLDGSAGEQWNGRAQFEETTLVQASMRCDTSGLKGSNCGSRITISAPAEEVFVLRPNGDIDLAQGTSLSAPIVSGVVALLRALRGTGEGMSADAIRALLVDTAKNIDATWNPGPMGLLDVRKAVTFPLETPSNQDVYIADQDAVSAPNGTGHVVAMQVDPMAGARSDPAIDRAIPLTLVRDGLTHQFTRPGAIAMDPAGQWLYVVATAADTTLGDGLLVISTSRHEVEDFIAFSGARLGLTPGLPRPPPVRSSAGRRTIVVSKDGRLVYAATGLSVTVVNVAEGRVVKQLADLPAVYRGGLFAVDPAGLSARMAALAAVLRTPVGGRQPTAITSLDISSNGTTLFGAVSTGGGAGLQPGALLSLNVNLYADITALQFGLQSDLNQFFSGATLSPMSGAAGTASAGDEPGVVVAGEDPNTAYLVNGGLDGFTTITGAEDYQLLLGLFGDVEVTGLMGDFARGVTLIRAFGPTAVFAPVSGPLQQIWQFPSNLNFSTRPSNARPVAHLPHTSPDVFASRPFSMAVRPDGRRALLPMFQTGNFGILDLDIQTRLLARPGNEPMQTLPANVFYGLVGVSESLRLDSHLWPSCGAIGGGLNADAPGPDESLLYAWDAVYAQNGRFAVATHTGVGNPRRVTATVPVFSQPPGSFTMAQLGYTIAGTTATDALGNEFSAGDVLSLERGGGGVTFIDDRALTQSLSADGIRSRTAVPLQLSDATAGNRCPSLRPGRLLGFNPSPGLTTRFHRPRGVGIQPFVYFESPRFGDHIPAAQPIYLGWRDPRIASIDLEVMDLADGATMLAVPPLSPQDLTSRTVTFSLASIFGALQLRDGQELRLTMVGRVAPVGNEPDGEELSRTSIRVTITDSGGGLQLAISPPLLIVPQVPNTASPRPLTVTLGLPDGTSRDVTADSDTRYQWIGQGLTEATEPGFAAARTALAQLLALPAGGPMPVAAIAVSASGEVTVQQPGVQLIRATSAGVPLSSRPVLVLAGFDLRSIEVDPETLLGPAGAAFTDRLRAQEPNAPLLLAADGTGAIPDQGVVALTNVRFAYLGLGRVEIRDLLGAVANVARVRDRSTVSQSLRELLRLTGAPQDAAAPMTYAVVAGGAFGVPIDLSCASGLDTSACVNAITSGASLVRGLLDLAAIGMSQAADHVLTLVLPEIETATIEPSTLVARRSQSPLDGPRLRTFAHLPALPSVSFAVPAAAPSADGFAGEWLPPSWLAGQPHVRFDFPDSLSLQLAFGVQRSSSDVTVTGFQASLTVPNDAAPDVTSTYALDNPALATLLPVDSYRSRVVHQNVVGAARITNPVTIAGLGSATATADVIVCDCAGAALVKRLTSPSTLVSSGDLVTYDVTAANSTNATISNVTVTDELTFGGVVVSRTTFPVFTLAPGESRSFPVSINAPFYGTTIQNTASAPGFTAAQPPPVTVLAPSAGIVISEMVLTPARDWSDSSGGNGVPFDHIPGSGPVDAGDIWIEVMGATTATSTWTIRVTDATGAVVSVPIGPVMPGGSQVRVLSGFDALTMPIATVEVVDGQGVVRQTIDVLAVTQVLGPSTGAADEALAWSVFGSPTPLLQQFTRRPSTPGGFNPL